MQDNFYCNLLGERLEEDFKDYMKSLLAMTPSEVMKHSYETVFKEEFLYSCIDNQLDEDSAKVLCRLDHPLDALYQRWLSNDYTYMEVVRDTIDDEVKFLEKHTKEKERGER